ncbi:MAG: endolytic transglycosylase MltG [Lachnospiraceae bacterium]|jgi:UPF0755 protein|nr:endolytic transglycosylase MltG [Lachnospiraceae bacterium]MDD3616461.1 endolytic transglycosylase MltG [Lachnospiraceae bacterium]
MAGRKKDQGYHIAISGAKGVIRLLTYICIAVLVIFLSRVVYGIGYDIFNQEPMETGEGKEITVEVEEGQSVRDIGEMLKDNGLIENVNVFILQEKLSRYKDNLLPGNYIVNTNMTADEIMAILSQENTEGQPEVQETETGENTGA